MKYLTCKNFKPDCLIPRLIIRITEFRWIPTVFTLKCDDCNDYENGRIGGE